MSFSQEQTEDTVISNDIVSEHIEQETTLRGNLADHLTVFELNMLKAELSRVDKQMMGYFPIEDNNSNFDLVEIKTTHPSVQETPHCKIHGSMNVVGVFDGGKLWRCLTSKALKDCRAGCIEKTK